MIALRVVRRFEINVVIGTVAPGRGVGEARPIVTPGRGGVSRFSVAQECDVAGRQVIAVILVEFIPARAFREDKERARPRVEARVVNPIGKKGQLRARAPRLGDEVHLVGVAEARENEHLRFVRMPVEETGRATLGITPNLFRDLRRDGRDTIEHQAVGRSERGRRLGREQEGEWSEGEGDD